MSNQPGGQRGDGLAAMPSVESSVPQDQERSNGQPETTVDKTQEPQPEAKGNGGTSNGGTEEQALESHEVIELQTFSERKAWIEEKIKVLSIH